MNPAASNLDEELRRFEYKVEAGAEFAVTQPVFDVAELRALPRSGSTPRGMPIVAGILPFESVRHAEFMANEVPGVHVPDAVLERMRRADGAEAAAARRACDRARDCRRASADGPGRTVSTASGDVRLASRRRRWTR